ncbi:MAG: NUDIX hydrolase [bacterium]
MSKIILDGAASACIIYRKDNPREIFLEIKDDGLPVKAFRRHLNPIGGNWIGGTAKKDKSPKETLIREIREELTLEKPQISTQGLKELGFIPEKEFYKLPDVKPTPTEQDVIELETVKEIIIGGLKPFQDYIITNPTEVFERADPFNKQKGSIGLISIWTCGLDEETWKRLSALQYKFGNLSNESFSLITSLEEIIFIPLYSAYGNDRPLLDFFISHSPLPLVKRFPLVEGINSEVVGKPKTSWESYLEEYEILRKP